jgi:hypothetical protein
VTLLLCASCGPTQASLSREEAAQLQMPGSTELGGGPGGNDEVHLFDVPAITSRAYGVDASWDELVAYFDRELKAMGWEDGGGSSGLTSTSENAVQAWHRDDRILRLGHMRNSPKPEAGSFKTFYSVALIGQGVQTD